MTMDRHQPFEELISASLGGDLTADERQRLDQHLDSCSQCRATLAAFADQRRIMSGLRHVGPPRDLGARVRTGIERGRFASVPWWRTPAVMFAGIGGSLAAVAGALLAIVLLNDAPSPEVGQATPTPSVVMTEPSETAQPTLPPIPTPTPDASPAETAAPSSIAPSATANPVVEAPEPDVVMAVTGPVEDLAFSVVEGKTGDEVVPIEETIGDDVVEPMSPSGPPIVAELSPDGQWLAFMTEVGGRGVNDVWATRLTEAPAPSADPEMLPPIDSSIPVGETVHLGETVAGSPFLERMSWSSDGRYLAYSLAAPDTEATGDASVDAWIFETDEGEAVRLTDVGNAYAASFIPSIDGTTADLWVSLAGDEPRSFVMELRFDGAIVAGDPAELGTNAADVFQPLLSPNGSLAIFWLGRMADDPDAGWGFVEDGAPYLAEHDMDEGAYAFDNERPLFSDRPVRGALFGSAAIAWSLDGDAYAVWDTIWTGEVAVGEEPYPDATRVYFGHATDSRGLTRQHAIDHHELDGELVIVDVEVAPTGRHLLITSRERPGGIGDVPRAELRLITRHTGDRPDESEQITEVSDDGWVGPAVFQPEPPELEWDPALAP
ncbi:MAG: zf-HC2 domain-containing protein [Chloroflexota bacterium]